MSFRRNLLFVVFLIVVLLGCFFILPNAYSQDSVGKVAPYVNLYEESQGGMTLLQMIKAGGFIMIILGILSMFALANVVYNFKNLNINKIVPDKFAEEVITKLEVGDGASVKEMCKAKGNIIAKIVMSGSQKKGADVVFIRDAMEVAAKKEISALWQQISYLADVASIAPLLGLLGTVLGMIQAFNGIAFQSAVVKPLLLAGGVSKAMITTAGGLMVAIPVMLFHIYFKGKVQEISDIVETYVTDIVRIIEES